MNPGVDLAVVRARLSNGQKVACHGAAFNGLDGSLIQHISKGDHVGRSVELAPLRGPRSILLAYVRWMIIPSPVRPYDDEIYPMEVVLCQSSEVVHDMLLWI
jgi:hypothetical protein